MITVISGISKEITDIHSEQKKLSVVDTPTVKFEQKVPEERKGTSYLES